MRKDIGIDLVRNPGRQDISSFTISYSAGDPHLAQQVTAELTGLFISENLKVRQQESEGTTTFLKSNWRMRARACQNRRRRFGNSRASTKELCPRKEQAIFKSWPAFSHSYKATRTL